MPALTATVTATTTHQIQLKPTVRRKLLTELKAYAGLKVQRDAIDAAMKNHRGTVEGLLSETGESSLSLDGFKTTLVAPVQKKLDRKKFIQLGGDIEILNAAHVETSGTPYVKITVPGKGSSDDDE